jgi:hypothetical protein
MSEESKAGDMAEQAQQQPTKARESKRNSIPSDVVSDIVTDIPQYTKASWLVVGHRGGVRLALPRTNGVSRAYFYGNGDYAQIPSHPAITVFTEEQRKEKHLGGVMAEVDFSAGVEAATAALALLAGIVRRAEAPPAKGLREPKAPRTAKKARPAIDADAVVDGHRVEVTVADETD